MNYLILFLTILAVLLFMFVAGYTVAYKRFSRCLELLRQQQQEDSLTTQVVCNKNQNSQQQQSHPFPTATREYSNIQPQAEPVPVSRRRGQGR